jgi:hypothetical protein
MDDPQHRREEERFLEDMPAFGGSRVLAGLRSVAACLALDYAGIDFGIAEPIVMAAIKMPARPASSGRVDGLRA